MCAAVGEKKEEEERNRALRNGLGGIFFVLLMAYFASFHEV